MAESDGMGAVLADLGANLVTVLVIVLALVAQRHAKGETPRFAPARVEATLSGRDQSDLLYLRLRPDPDILLIEAGPQGLRRVDAAGLRPLTDAPPLPRRAVAFLFSPRLNDPLRQFCDRHGIVLTEMTVPSALRGGDGAGFSVDFLSIRVGAEAASIRPELLRLLTRGGAGGMAGAMGEAGAATSALARIMAWLWFAAHGVMLLATLAGMRWLWRATRPALS